MVFDRWEHFRFSIAMTTAIVVVGANAAHAQDPSAMPALTGNEPPWMSIITVGLWASVELFRKIESIRKVNYSTLQRNFEDLQEEHSECDNKRRDAVEAIEGEYKERIKALEEAHKEALEEERRLHAAKVSELSDEIELMRGEHFELRLKAETATLKAEHAANGSSKG